MAGNNEFAPEGQKTVQGPRPKNRDAQLQADTDARCGYSTAKPVTKPIDQEDNTALGQKVV